MGNGNLNLETNVTETPLISPDKTTSANANEDEINRLRAELKSEREERLRLAAEFENYRRRVRREQADAAHAGKRELLERLITIADDFDLALANLDESTGAVAEGLRLIQRRFSEMLAANGVAAFESKGEAFDPQRHEAFDVVNGTEDEPGSVHREVRRGYFWNGKLLRPALVIVAQ